jgi:hypothetical protein
MSDSGSGDNSLEELREATEGGSKIEDTDPEQEFVELLGEELESMDNSRGNLNLTVNDPEMWALFQALEKDDERYRAFREELSVDLESESRGVVLRALLRRGVADADGQLADEMREALATRAAEEF